MRFYEVDVVATDKAGNSAKAVCKVMVVPKDVFNDEFPPADVNAPIKLLEEIMNSQQRFEAAAADLSLHV